MVLIGFVLLAAAVAVGIDVVVQNQSSIDLEAFGQGFATSPAAVLTAGVVIGLTASVGIMLMRDGLIRRRRRHHETKLVAAERDRLAAEAKDEHAEHRFDVGALDDNSVDVRDRDRVTTF